MAALAVAITVGRRGANPSMNANLRKHTHPRAYRRKMAQLMAHCLREIQQWLGRQDLMTTFLMPTAAAQLLHNVRLQHTPT
jgi:integrase